MKQLFPYPRLNTPELSIVSPSRFLVSADVAELDFRDAFSDGTTCIELIVQLQLTGSDQPRPEFTACAVVQCDSTDFRVSVPLLKSDSDPAIWWGTVQFDFRNLRGTTALRGVIAGPVLDTEYRILGESVPWKVIVDDEARGLPQGALDLRWVDFSTRPDLIPYATEPFFVDLSVSPPAVLLNDSKDMEDLRRIFPATGRPHAPLSALYEGTRAGFARSVWAVLFQAALNGINRGDEGEEPDWPASQWQRDVLQRILAQIYVAEDADSLKRAVTDLQTPEGYQELTSRALLVIQKHLVQEGRRLRTAIRELDRR